MGIATELSTNPAMTLGGLTEGVTPLEMAYAYSTIANGGVRVSGTLASRDGRPGGLREGRGRRDRRRRTRRSEDRIFPSEVAGDAKALLEGVVLSGTGKAAQIGEFAAGKTGTTENYGDAWFVGLQQGADRGGLGRLPGQRSSRWRPSTRGGPVAGGTFPADIWHDFMTSLDRRSASSARRSARAATTRTRTCPSLPVAPDEALRRGGRVDRARGARPRGTGRGGRAQGARTP